MSELSLHWFVLTADVSFKAILLAAAAGLTLGVPRVRNSNAQHAVWLGVLLGMLALPLLSLTLPEIALPLPSRLEVLLRKESTSPRALESGKIAGRASKSSRKPLDRMQVGAEGQVRPLPAEAAADLAGDQPRSGHSALASSAGMAPDLRAGIESKTAVAGIEPKEVASGESASAQRLRALSVSWPVLAAAIWGFGLVVLAFRLMLGIVVSRRLVHRSARIPAPSMSALGTGLDAAPRKTLANWADLEIRECCEVVVPVTAGVVRSTVLLPLEWRTWPSEKLREVLIHEHTHVRRRDCLTAFLADLATCLYWFHPLVWWLRRRLAMLAEASCDDAAIGSTGDRTVYARHLLEIASVLSGRSGRVVYSRVSMARRSNVENRINAILDFNRPLSRRLTWAATLLVASLMGPLVGVTAALRPAGDGEPVPRRAAVPSARPASREKRSATADEDRERFNGKLFLSQNRTVHISGRATNQDGKPVAGATVSVAQDNDFNGFGLPDPVLGTTRTDPDGRYDFPNLSMPVLQFPPQPVPRPIEGRFQVVSTAAGYGYTWRKPMSYRPSHRPATAESQAIDPAAVFYKDEPIQVALQFLPEVRVHGKVADDFGKPIEGAEIQLGAIRDIRRGDWPNAITWACWYLKQSPFAAEGGCNVVRFLPKQFLLARTDAAGRYEIAGIPRDAHLIAQVTYRKDYATHSFGIETTAGASDKFSKKVGYDGAFDYILAAPREIRVRVTEEQSARPATDATVTARGRSIQRSGAQAKTGSDGVAVLHLTAGDYTIIAEPSPRAALLRGSAKLTVKKESHTQETTVALGPAARVAVRTVENGSGRPIAGAVVFSEREGNSGVTRLQSQTVFIDNPVTNGEGTLHAIVAPGRWRFFAAGDVQAGSRRASSAWFDLSAGKEATVTIALPREPVEETPRPQATVAMSAAQQQFEQVREMWHRQWLLCSRGRYRIRINNFLLGDVPRARLAELSSSCEGRTADECLATLAAVFPNLPAKLRRQELFVDRDRLRVSSTWADPKAGKSRAPEHIFVFNGQETIVYDRNNAQVDIYGIDNAMEGSTRLLDLLSPSGDSSREPRTTVSGDQWPGSVAVERNRLRFVTGDAKTLRSEYLVDAVNGFPFRWVVDGPAHQIAQEDWQFGPQRQPNGGIVPTVHFRFVYDNQKLRYAQFVIIDEVKLMDRVPPEAFVVAAEAGANVLDYRGIPRRQMGTNQLPRSAVVREPVPDVVARANELAPRKAPILSAGDTAPSLDVANWIAGGTTSSAPQMDGKIVLVNFSAHWCGPCRNEWARIEAASRHFAKADAIVVLIFDAGDSESDIEKDIQKDKLTNRIAIDKPVPRRHGFGKTALSYGVHYLPQSAVIDRDGKVAYIGDLTRALTTVDRLVNSAKPTR